jgi:hypothetical protein
MFQILFNELVNPKDLLGHVWKHLNRKQVLIIVHENKKKLMKTRKWHKLAHIYGEESYISLITY